jgi:MFS family permease
VTERRLERPLALALLRGNRPFLLLWTSRATSFVGSSLGLVALLLHVADEYGHAWSVVLLLLVGDFAPALLSPVTGALSDRVNLRWLMVACEAAQAALFLGIALLPPLPVLLALFAVTSTCTHVFWPASRTAVGYLVEDRQLPAANSAIGFGENGLELAGPLLAAALVGTIGVRGLLLVDAASFLLSALLLLALPSMPAVRLEDEEPTSLLRHARAGLRYLGAVPAVRILAVSFFAVVACNGLDDAALVLLATGPLQASQSATSLLYAGAGTGLLAGYVAMSRYGSRLTVPSMLIAGYAVSSLGNLLTGPAWAVSAALLAQTVRGLGLAAQDVAAATLIQRTVPRQLQGRVFGNFYGAIGLAAGLSYVVGGLLLHLVGPRLTLVVGGAGGLMVAAWTAARRTTLSAAAAPPAEAGT